MADCLFCKIARGEIPADVVHKDATVTVFRDITPHAPVHLLVIPNQHVGSAGEIGPGNGALMAAMITAANAAADAEGVSESGYRLVFNVGRDAGMTVPHLHLHVLGGRHLAWPPG
ncbi:MAG: Bis(5'-nucleosyl)-tetraphosphatase (asymmetrical) [uncultured Chloroflexi bacterium]|uniref:Bis(5'-nucleosyl)-tetraphosphatase (Asymmetrical) n=1 Tax=uncultured Chloroflexota bacterium TaxID=166587 RepID=A0A6J4J8S3_9CHLR|nr:MAG: Bis(5'-nucleosyl)-tetraphosphatase (asymmetrical) [uncultured Chloroflexota bacterium]